MTNDILCIYCGREDASFIVCDECMVTYYYNYNK